MRLAMVLPPSLVLALMTTGAMAETEQRSFDVSAGDRFVLDADWGKVDVGTWDEDVVDIVVERADKLESLDFDDHDGTITVRARKKDQGIRGWFGANPGPVFRVSVPRRFDLDLVTAGGSIAIADIAGQVSARTAGGSLTIGEVTGSIHARTAGGSVRIAGSDEGVDARTTGGTIRLGRAGGAVEARTTGGSIHIGSAGGTTVAYTTGGSIDLGEVGGTIDAKTTGGSIRATLARQPEGDSRMRTTGGSINLVVAEHLELDIDARSTGGRVTSELAQSVPESSRKAALVASMNGGGPKLTLRTTGGSIRLHAP